VTVREEAGVTAFTLTPLQQALAHEVRQLAATELRPLAEAGEPGRVNRELIRAMGRLGLLIRLFPGAAGRQDSYTVPASELTVLWEALATECTSAALALILQGLGTYPLARFGTAGQAQRWLPAVSAGEAVAGVALTSAAVPAAGPDRIAAQKPGSQRSAVPGLEPLPGMESLPGRESATGLDAGLEYTGLEYTGLEYTGLEYTGLEDTAPESAAGLGDAGLENSGLEGTAPESAAGLGDAGLEQADADARAGGHDPLASDAAATGLTAEPEGDGWRLTGEQSWVYNAPEADFYTVFAGMGTGPGGTAAGISAFLVPAIRPGLSAERLDFAGPHPVGSLAFDGVPVVTADLVGEPGHGTLIAAAAGSAFRLSAAAFLAGIARAALDMAAAHVTAGMPSGMPAGRRSVTQLLAEMATRTEAARLLVYAAAAAAGTAGQRTAGQSAMAELCAVAAAQFVVDGAMEVIGAGSLQLGHRLEQLCRDVRAARLYRGCPDQLYDTITGQLLR
jgi:acyl-CoA dehydrogenase